jgi:hypothetical protein
MNLEYFTRLAWDNGYMMQEKEIKHLMLLFNAITTAEREACATVVDDFGDEWICDARMLSKIIRARGEA